LFTGSFHGEDSRARQQFPTQARDRFEGDRYLPSITPLSASFSPFLPVSVFQSPHVRFADLQASELNLSEKRIWSGGVYRNQAEREFPCTLKLATNEEQLKKLERERDTLEMIRSRDVHQESHKFLVSWLFPSQLMSEDSLHFLTQSGDHLLPSPPLSHPLRGLVLESGGPNLREFLRNETLSSVPMSQRIHVLEEVVEAVKFLHQLGVVHFDLKPENIVCFSSSGRDKKARWKLIDFDSSCEDNSSSSSAHLWLSEEFMCPEIAGVVESLNRQKEQREQQDCNSPASAPPSPADATYSSSNLSIQINQKMDIWSLGLVAFFLFTNRSLWSDYSAAPVSCSMVAGVRQEEIQLILVRSLGHKEKSFVESCLRVDPSGRWSGTELLGKSLFSTGDSTVQANTLRVVNESMLSRFDEIQNLVRAYSDRCSPELMSEDLANKFSDLQQCLAYESERVSNLTLEEMKALLGTR
jgi:hypothetical protein